MTTGRINQVCASPQSGTGWINHRTSSAAVNKVWFCHHTQSNRERRLLHAFRTCALTPAVETQWRSNAPPRCLWLQGYAYPQERRMLESCAPILNQSKYPTKAKVRGSAIFAPPNAKLDPHGNHDNAGRHRTQLPVNHDAAAQSWAAVLVNH